MATVSDCGGMHIDDVLPVADAAELIGTSRWTINRRVSSGHLRAVNCGSVRLVVKADVLAMGTRLAITSPTLDGAPIVTLSSDAEEAA
jgi:excisionase family DNA binding protein